jgi:hypothetical protein
MKHDGQRTNLKDMMVLIRQKKHAGFYVIMATYPEWPEHLKMIVTGNKSLGVGVGMTPEETIIRDLTPKTKYALCEEAHRICYADIYINERDKNKLNGDEYEEKSTLLIPYYGTFERASELHIPLYNKQGECIYDVV